MRILVGLSFALAALCSSTSSHAQGSYWRVDQYSKLSKTQIITNERILHPDRRMPLGQFIQQNRPAPFNHGPITMTSSGINGYGQRAFSDAKGNRFVEVRGKVVPAFGSLGYDRRNGN
jgi:hypothetical protein